MSCLTKRSQMLLLATVSVCLAQAARAADVDLAAARDAVRAAEDQRVESLNRAAESVVAIFSTPTSAGGGGSGVIISPDGYGLSNYHVVAGLLPSRRGYGGLSNGRLYPLRVLGVDPVGDVAMFKLEGAAAFPHAPLGDTEIIHAGQPSAAMGNPFLLAEDYSPTITVGVLSGVRRYQYGTGSDNILEYADCLQSSSSINPGNSGGPLFDLAGEILGINGRGSFEHRGRVNVGLGYAISINQIKRFLPGLRAGRLVEHGTLGAAVRQVGDEVILSDVPALSAAERAGLERGDVLVEIDGRRIRTENDFVNWLATFPADWPVDVRYRRGGALARATARLDALPISGKYLYVTDLEHNHAEIRAQLTRFRARLSVQPSESPDAHSISVRMREAPDGAVVPEALQAEAREITAPLLASPDLDINWELIGGDTLDGRLVSVIEHRFASGRSVRWAFDWRTDELRRVSIRDGDEDAPVVWTPLRIPSDAASRWPVAWRRKTAEGEQRVEIVRAPGATAPDATPPAELADAPASDDRSLSDPHAAPPSFSDPLALAVDTAQQRVVKIYGAEFGRESGYGSGVLISHDGKVVTTLSPMLQSPSLRVVLADGRRFPAEILRRDRRRQLALLKLDATDLPFFRLDESEHLRRADWLISAGNPFKVAAGREPVSITIGAFSGRSTLQARRRTQDVAYAGPILLTDLIVSTIGYAGGALVDADGRLVGVVGEAATSEFTNTLLNYALPVEQVRQFLEAKAAKPRADLDEPDDIEALSEVLLTKLGIRLFDIGGRKRPAYVERVTPASPVAQVGLRADDLILAVNDEMIETCDDLRRALAELRDADRIDLLIKRGEEVVSLVVPMPPVESLPTP